MLESLFMFYITISDSYFVHFRGFAVFFVVLLLLMLFVVVTVVVGIVVVIIIFMFNLFIDLFI